MWKYLVFITLAVGAAACGDDYLYEKEIPLPPDGWNYSDTLAFDFEVSDTSAIYNLILAVDHGTEFPFQNLYVEFFTKFPEGQRIREMASLELANRAGEWLGQCSGEDCAISIPIQQNAFFNQTGDYEITIKQFTRKNPIIGVDQVALKIQDTGQRR